MGKLSVEMMMGKLSVAKDGHYYLETGIRTFFREKRILG